MAHYQEITRPKCDSNVLMKTGRKAHGEQRFRAPDFPTKTFIQKYRYRAYELGLKEQALDMTIKGNGLRDAAWVLKIDKNIVSCCMQL
jgi:transposase-like protein